MTDEPATLRQEIATLAEKGDVEGLQAVLRESHPADVADSLDGLPPEHALAVFSLLAPEAASEVLDETGSRIRRTLVEKVDDERLADLLDELPMDDAAEFLENLPEQTARRLLRLMEPEEAQEVESLLHFEEETAGRLMTRDVAVLRRHWIVEEALAYLRSLERREASEMLHYLYVVEDDNLLIGVVPVRALLLAPTEATIESIMTSHVISVPAWADQEVMAGLVAKYDFVAIPVVDDEGRILGVVTVDDILDVIEEEATEDIQRLGGSQPLAQPYFAVSVPAIVRKRIGWLLFLFVADTLTGSVLRFFEDELAAAVSLSFFIPLIIGTGGNTGSQTVTTIVRAIALHEVRLRDLGRVLWRESSSGIVLGVLLAVIGFFRALTWQTGPNIAFVVAATLAVVVLWSNLIAAVIPILAERFRIDPTVVSAPLITTIVDATGLAIYFGLAKWILGI
jgi:magnesium transporter